jgi:hypothetical protein
MKIYRHWALEKARITIGREEKEIRCWGGSFTSLEEARVNALERASWVQKKVRGERVETPNYEAAIREEILEEIGPDAVVTRNRYGAKVLNVAKLMFLDIDHAPFNLMRMFAKRDVKTEAMARIEKLAATPKYAHLGFRIYETSKGIRAIVTGRDFEARSVEAQALMKEFGCDRLYIVLCRKQNCFRARLTPKPFRLKLAGMKFIYPYEPAQQAAQKEWLKGYEQASGGFGTCRFIKTVGQQSWEGPVVKYHDTETGAYKTYPLA